MVLIGNSNRRLSSKYLITVSMKKMVGAEFYCSPLSHSHRCLLSPEFVYYQMGICIISPQIRLAYAIELMP